jgi:alpha-galactosidase/6-phospho-beta-glucosidase family protein
VGELPAVPKSFIEPYANVFPAVVDACFKGDRKLALRALRMDPVCSHLNGEEVLQMGEKLLGAHREFIDAF